MQQKFLGLLFVATQAIVVFCAAQGVILALKLVNIAVHVQGLIVDRLNNSLLTRRFFRHNRFICCKIRGIFVGGHKFLDGPLRDRHVWELEAGHL